jgi:hypothetical protein
MFLGTLLTLVLLMQAIDKLQYHVDSMEALEKLVKFDPLRSGYYNDLSKSSFINSYHVFNFISAF